MTEAPETLWNQSVGPAQYGDGNAGYQAAIFEQYKLYVEMADRVSARRNLANTFFLTLNSFLVTGLTVAFGVSGNGSGSQQVDVPSLWALLPALVILVAMCITWHVMVRSYRQLNGAKYAVIGAMEAKLPAYAYSRAEWQALGEGADWRRYIPLTHVEQFVPVLFAFGYVLGFVILWLR